MIHYTIATANDCNLLTQTAIAAKKHWGYTPYWIQKWAPQLTIDDTTLEESIVVKIHDDSQFVGFYALTDMDTYVELSHMWIHPTHIGKGYGRQSFTDIRQRIAQFDMNVLEVESDPNAEGFYSKMGGKVIGKTHSSQPGGSQNIYQIKW